MSPKAYFNAYLLNILFNITISCLAICTKIEAIFTIIPEYDLILNSGFCNTLHFS